MQTYNLLNELKVKRLMNKAFDVFIECADGI